MQRMMTWMACFVVFLFVGIVQAQSRLSIGAASAEPVEGWQMMQVEHCQSRCAVWVSPTAAITASDIEKAQPETTDDGRVRIAVIFTDAGARKIRELSIAQRNKLVAMVLDGRLVWAPLVTSEIGKQSVLTGNGPSGLTQEEVERIMAILR